MSTVVAIAKKHPPMPALDLLFEELLLADATLQQLRQVLDDSLNEWPRDAVQFYSLASAHVIRALDQATEMVHLERLRRSRRLEG